MLHSKQWHYSLHRDFQNCYSTRRKPTGFFSSNSSSNSTGISIHNYLQRILHPESNSTCRRQRVLRVLLLHSRGQRDLHSRKRNSTHRRQGDLLEVHPCVLQDLPKTFQAFQPQDLPKAFQTFQSLRDIPDIPDIPVIHDLPAFPGNSTNSSISRESNPFSD